MSTTAKWSRRRLFAVAILVAAIGCGIVAFGLAAKRARHDARMLNAEGHLSQMRLALENYEAANGSLPPLFLRDGRGRPIQSWRALVVPYIEMVSLRELDLSQPWDSAGNRKIIDQVPQREWGWFARDIVPDSPPPLTYLVAWTGTDSLWDAKIGLPKGAIRENPNAVLLISVPESNIHPLEPRDLTEEQVRALVEDGQEVLFIRAHMRDGYGLVKMDHGRLVCKNWQEP